MNILIVDDHPIVRHGLRLLLETRGAATRVGEAGDADEAMARLREGGWDVMVLDIDLPGRSGLEVLHEAKARWPKLPVLILSIHPENMLAVRLLKSGAAGSTVGEIAERLHLSVNTVSTYRSRVLEKLGAANNAELMRYAAERRLV
ncbi:MAG: response regulator transcription factor [Rhodocyclaceae bacterium]|nr:response regulator transcription factor [Rhodocyclaceae bacterium]